jgi:hypothetical protein
MQKQLARAGIFLVILALAAAGNAVFFFKVFEETYPYNGWFPGFFIDFKNTWYGAWSWWNGELRTIFDAADFNFGMRRWFALEGGHIWSYPLHFMMLTLPFGAMPFPLAALTWTLLGLIAYGVFLERTISPSRTVLLLIVISGGFLNTMAFGQMTFFAAILLVGGLWVLPTRPVLAGICFGILTIKPHFGVLLPIVLLTERRWSAIASTCATACGLLLASLVVIGPEAWALYIKAGMGAQTEAMLERLLLWSWEPTWYAALRWMSFDRTVALAAQSVAAAASVAALLWMQRIGVPERTRHALVPLLTLFALPYVLPSDLLLLSPLLALRIADPRTPLPAFALLSVMLLCSGFFFVTSRITMAPLFAVVFTLTVAWFVHRAVAEARGALAGSNTAAASPSGGNLAAAGV